MGNPDHRAGHPRDRRPGGVRPRGSGGQIAAARLLYVGHATVLIELDGVRLLTDPVLRTRIMHLRRRVALEPEALRDLTATLVSHVHFDHLDLPSLRSLGRQLPVVVPRGAGRLLRGFADVREVDVGDEVRFGDVSVLATPAEHAGTRLMLRDAPSLGFLVSGSKRVYFAGDTDLFEGMSAIAEGLDVALVPVAGWGRKVGAGHLDPERAARAVQLLRPRIAVPIHWGTFSLPRVATSDEPPERFRRLAADLTPDVDVQVLEPGKALTF